MNFFLEAFDTITKRRVIEDLQVGDTTLEASYYPTSGKVSFGISPNSENYNPLEDSFTTLTGEGAFKTMDAVIGWLDDQNAKRIYFNTKAPTRHEINIRDKLYQRALTRAGYEPVKTEDFTTHYETSWEGPTRHFRKSQLATST